MSTDENKNNTNQEYDLDTLTNKKLLKDHDYDGIKELDNDLPPWWKWLFYITLIFGAIYLVRLWAFNAPDLVQEKEYEKWMKKAEQEAPKQTTELKLLTAEAALISGKDVYEKSCSACHGMDGGGLVGPNLTDENWLYENTFESMYKITSSGVSGTSMLAYESKLSPQKRVEVVSYMIKKLYGTTPASPKAAEGEKRDWNY